jgi:DNA ligase (NAD+)
VLLCWLESSGDEFNPEKLISLFSRPDLNTDELVFILKASNALYRAGNPILSDEQYDLYFSLLRNKNLLHPYLNTVEPELLIESKTVVLPERMLSTEKAYSVQDIERWVKRLQKAAQETNISEDEIDIRVTPKLDGYAAYDDGSTLFTRGDGYRGQDITRAFKRGLKVASSGERGLGPGEIVIKKSYFAEVLSNFFENSRNIQAAIIAEKKVDNRIQKAIEDGACVFYPFALIKSRTVKISVLMVEFESIVEDIWNAVDFDVDGVILETTNEIIKKHMGATRRNHRWQIAFKVNEESANVEVIRVIPQTSRTGRIAPVAELVPTKLSGVTISRVTVHHYNMVKTIGVGAGALIRLVRSGLVIPKIEEVLKKVDPEIPDSCPSCGSHLLWEADNLICPNKIDCPAQTENTLVHFFKTLGNNDGFGSKTIEKLASFGVKHIHEIYRLEIDDFLKIGFGEKTAINLFNQLQASRSIEIEDWRFLSAFGVSRLGAGNCEKLLGHHSLVSLFELTVSDMIQIDGFAEISAEAIKEGLENIREEFFKVYDSGFTLKPTVMGDIDKSSSPISGAIIVFTGTMIVASRADMEKNAKALGAKVAKSVTSKTTYLVTGDKVGETKINAAKDKGVKVLSEQQYLDFIN